MTHALSYNPDMTSRAPELLPPTAVVAAALAALCALLACSRSADLPRDANLETCITVSARCAYVDRAFSSDPGLFAEEIRAVNLPASWKALSDSLIATHGTDARFWYQVYSRIVQESRK